MVRSLAVLLCVLVAACGKGRASVAGQEPIDAGPRAGGAPRDGGLGGGSAGGRAGGGSAGGPTNDGGTAPVCGPRTCPDGCCSQTGVCITPTTTARCGAGGASCQACTSGNTCVAGACTPCAGCVDIRTGACVSGTADDACGRGGMFCDACDSSQALACSAGVCMNAAGGAAGGGSATGGGGGFVTMGGGFVPMGGGFVPMGGGFVPAGGGFTPGGGGSAAGGAGGGSFTIQCDLSQRPPGGLANNQLLPDGGFSRLTGGQVTGSLATFSGMAWSSTYLPGRSVDGDPATSFFAATSTCAFVGLPEYCCAGVSLTVDLPAATEVSAVKLIGNREFPTGYDLLSGRLLFLDGAGVERGRAPFIANRPDGDWGAVIGTPLQQIRSVRVEFEWAEGSGPGLAELQVFSPQSWAVVDGGISAGAVGWTQTAGLFRTFPGARVTVECPPGGPALPIWGTDLYTDDSSICAAAIHAGVISATTGGPVTFTVAPGQSSYVGSTRNGITSLSWQQYQGSFCFGACRPGGSVPDAGQVVDAGAPGAVDAGLTTLFDAGVISWNDTTMSWPIGPGSTAEGQCPPGLPLNSVWGTGVYTGDSSVCAAAVHDGRIMPLAGGAVRVVIRPGISLYQGSTQNGVSSSQWGAYSRSFSFLP